MHALRRTWVEPFTAPDMHTLATLEALAAAGDEAGLDALLLPVDAGLTHFTAIAVDADGARRIAQGQAVPVAATAATDTVNIVGPDGRSLGLGLLDDEGRLRPRRLFKRA